MKEKATQREKREQPRRSRLEKKKIAKRERERERERERVVRAKCCRL